MACWGNTGWSNGGIKGTIAESARGPHPIFAIGAVRAVGGEGGDEVTGRSWRRGRGRHGRRCRAREVVARRLAPHVGAFALLVARGPGVVRRAIIIPLALRGDSSTRVEAS